jgi:tRNA A58 N-methylase Trm61
MTTEVRTYLMGRSEAETRRLMAQHRLYGTFTRRLLEDAGIEEGMKVLDVGSGAGDVALLAAEFVGPTGSVAGVDQDSEVLETASARAEAFGLTNVSFHLATSTKAFLMVTSTPWLGGSFCSTYPIRPKRCESSSSTSCLRAS